MYQSDNPAIRDTVNRIAWMQDDLDDFKAFAKGRDDTFADIWMDAIEQMSERIEDERAVLNRLKGHA